MKNFRKLTAFVVLLAALSAPALAGDMETPPAPEPTPTSASAPVEPTPTPLPGDMETPPSAVMTETVLDLMLTVLGLI